MQSLGRILIKPINFVENISRKFSSSNKTTSSEVYTERSHFVK